MLWTRVAAAVVAVVVSGTGAQAKEPTELPAETGSTAESVTEVSPEVTPGGDSAVEGEDVPEELPITDHLLVTGGPVAVEKLPGSAHFIGAETLARHSNSDIHRILQQVEGVTVQEEDGFGLRPNIGMRGTGVNRSEKITVLEDGVLIAPAPYAAPAAYYFPTSERMEAVEVRKGSSTITHGPYTTGGVLNLVSTSIPAASVATAKLSTGSHRTIRAYGSVGDSRERGGWLLEGYRLANDGFKDLDGGGTTGVELTDLVGKGRWNSPVGARVDQSFELKLGWTKQRGEETYLGLTQEDFDRTPLRRYAASQQDVLEAEHDQVQLRYLVMPGSNTVLTTTLYRNGFFRNWHKLQSVDGTGLSRVLDAPDLFLRQRAVLAGEVDALAGDLVIRNNRRDYLSEGIEARLTRFAAGSRLEHEIEVGLRLHRDEEDRFQEEDLWNMVDRRMEPFSLGTPGSQSNRISSAEAIALYISDTLRLGDWTVTPGVRFERIDFEVVDFGKSDPSRSGDDRTVRLNDASVALPGVGVSYRLGSNWNLLGGIHRGFAAPGPGQDPDTDAEESLNHELGFNYRSTSASVPMGARVVGFFNDYENLIGRDSLSTGGDGTDSTFNGGAATVRGIEAAFDVDLGSGIEGLAGVPVRLGYTRTQAEFGTTFATRFEDWSPEVREGDRMPYLPEDQLSISIGLVDDRWQTFLSAGYVGDMRTKPGTGPIDSDERIESHVVVDVAARVELREHLELSVEVRNLFDRTYVASRRPAGLRPGLPQTLLIGLNWRSSGRR